MRSLVTGAAGFLGSYLVEHLLGRRDSVAALTRRPSPFLDRLDGQIRVHTGDTLDRGSVSRLVGEVKPDRIFHLAARSLPAVSWEDPAGTFQVNVVGTLNLLDAVRLAGIDPVIVVVGSSAEYAPGRAEVPIPEDWPLAPASPYGVSKLAQDHLARLYGRAYPLRIVRVRPFFLVGPRKTGDVCSDLARRIVAIERGRSADLPVGNLEVVRDLLDVRDGVTAFATLAEQGRPGEVYNVASGRGYRIRDVLGMLKALARVPVRERVDPSKLRAIDEMVKIGDPARLVALGWRPSWVIERTLADILEYWRGTDEREQERGEDGRCRS